MNGVSSSARLTLAAYVTGVLGLATGGTSTRCSSRSTAASITSGADDQDDDVLEILVQSHRDKKAAKKFLANR